MRWIRLIKEFFQEQRISVIPVLERLVRTDCIFKGMLLLTKLIILSNIASSLNWVNWRQSLNYMAVFLSGEMFRVTIYVIARCYTHHISHTNIFPDKEDYHGKI